MKNENVNDIKLSMASTAEGVYLGFNSYIKDDKRIITHYVIQGNYNSDLGCFSSAELRKVTETQDKTVDTITHYTLMERVKFDFEARQFGTKVTFTCSNIRKSM